MELAIPNAIFQIKFCSSVKKPYICSVEIKEENMARYQRMGYYNDAEDIKELFNATRDEVMNFHNKDYGQFYPDDDEIRDGVDFDTDSLGVDGDEFIVVKDIPKNKEDIGEDSYIDIYEKLPVLDKRGKPIHKDDIVDWHDPETKRISRYMVYEEPTEDMVKLWSRYGECEALPEECVVFTKL